MKSFSRYIPKFLALAIVALATTLSFGGHAHADSYNSSNLIDNSVFLNTNAMSQSAIQSFLNNEGGALASQSFATQSNGTQSAAWIIYYTSQDVGISPQVIMATLQKEESLITDPSPSSGKYNAAMGYACSDSSPCNSAYAGFFNQVWNGSWQLRLNYERALGNNGGWTAPDGNVLAGTQYSYACASAAFNSGAGGYSTGLYSGRNVTFYDPSHTAYANITLANAATASLYCYTPHVYPGDANYYYSGSYNFVQSFISWWGAVHIPSYGWSIVSQSYGNGNNNIAATAKETLTVVAKNTGTATWTNSSNPVRLATVAPQNRVSGFYDPSWVSASRAATLTESSVAPGSNGTFTFTIQAPSAPGDYQERFSLVAENQAWFNDPGMYFDLNVTPATFGAQLVSQNFPTTVGANATANVTVVYKNTSNVTWYNSGAYPISLGTASPYNHASVFAASGWPSPARAAVMTESSVAPGSNGTFSFQIAGPITPGAYSDSFDVVAENAAWMGAPITANVLSVGTYNWQIVSQSYSTNSTTLLPGQSATLTVVAKNTGSATWTQGGSNPVRLATTYPQNRASLFATTGWISSSRPAALTETSVAPGSNGTFTFNVTAPGVINSFQEHFSLVAEGLTWFNDPGMYFEIDVPTPVYSWQIVSQSYSSNSTNLAASSSETLTVVAKNTGNTTWANSGGTPIRLATTSPRNRSSLFAANTWISPARPATTTESSVAPGSNGTFTFTVQAPSTRGVYQEHLSLVDEGVTWLNDPGMYFYINVQ